MILTGGCGRYHICTDYLVKCDKCKHNILEVKSYFEEI